MVGGKLLHGLVHPEFGHIRIPHDPRPTHSWALVHTTEIAGKDSHPAARSRSAGDCRRVELSRRLSLGTASPSTSHSASYPLSAVLSPERIILGGGVMNRPGLVGARATERRRTRERVPRSRNIGSGHLDVHHASVPRLPHWRPGRYRSSPIGWDAGAPPFDAAVRALHERERPDDTATTAKASSARIE